jgi:hypothetical protein
MLTRSKQLIQEQLTKEVQVVPQNILEVNIDFDEAIREWRSNKKSIGNSQYKYICPIIVKGNACGRSCYKNADYCWIHRTKIN